MSLREHAERELARIGMLNRGTDYEQLIAQGALDLIKTFAGQGHSGQSAELTLALFDKLVRFEPLSPVTSDPTEWEDRTEMSGRPFWQNIRDPKCFSENGGKTWTRLEEKKHCCAS